MAQLCGVLFALQPLGSKVAVKLTLPSGVGFMMSLRNGQDGRFHLSGEDESYGNLLDKKPRQRLPRL
jgi:hypothetical protein